MELDCRESREIVDHNPDENLLYQEAEFERELVAIGIFACPLSEMK